MKYADIARGALVLVLGMMTSTVLAQGPILSEGFESISTETNLLNASVTPPWTGGADDISTVVAVTPDEPEGGFPLPASTHTKVLQLNTEGGTLTNTLTTAADFSTANVYVDSMVKFVPSEDLATIDDDGVKVAVYAYITEDGENVSTNLAIYHAIYTGGELQITNTVTDLPIDASAWYRLTILLAYGEKAFIGSVGGAQIYLDGVPLTNDNAYAGDTWADVADVTVAPSDGTWFASACSVPEVADSVETLQFRGTGFVDDLVVGAGDPFEQGEPPTGFDVTQNIGANGASSDPTSPIHVDGVSTTLTYTADDFYVIDSLKTNDVEVAGAAGAKSKSIDIYSTTTVTSSFVIVSSLTAGNVSWFQANNWGEDDVVVGLDYANLQMLNVAATNAAAGGTLTIEAIEVVDDDVKVTVFIDRTMSLGTEITGTLKLYGATTLEGGFEELGTVTIGGDLDGTQDDIRKDITFPDAGDKKFFKAVIVPAS